MASATPRSSDSMPGYAAGVSTNTMIGRRNFSAIRIARSAFRYPSGLAYPKLRAIFSFVVRPFWCPMTSTGAP